MITIPPCILKSLEKNEDKKALIFFEKIPILGVYVEACCHISDATKSKK